VRRRLRHVSDCINPPQTVEAGGAWKLRAKAPTEAPPDDNLSAAKRRNRRMELGATAAAAV